jgi:hypothetical protein
MANSTTITAIYVQSFIFQKDPKRLTSFSSKRETWLQRFGDFNFHKKPKITSECLLFTTDVINLNKLTKSFTNSDGNVSSHVDQGQTMNLNPERSSEESEFIESGLWLPLLEND